MTALRFLTKMKLLRKKCLETCLAWHVQLLACDLRNLLGRSVAVGLVGTAVSLEVALNTQMRGNDEPNLYRRGCGVEQ